MVWFSWYYHLLISSRAVPEHFLVGSTTPKSKEKSLLIKANLTRSHAQAGSGLTRVVIKI